MRDQAQRLRILINESKQAEVKKEELQSRKDIKIYAISSGKGGVGKTNFVLNTAITFQQMGKRVLIIDTDFGFANIDVLCGLTPTKSLLDVLNGDLNLKDVIMEGPEGIQIIPGGSELKNLQFVDEKHQQIIKEQFELLDDIDIILIDTGAGISKTLLLYVMFAKDLLLVVTPEPTAITDGYSFLKVIDQYQIKKSIYLVINQVESKEEANKTFQLMEETSKHFLKIKLNYAGCIKSEKIVSTAVKKQIPFVITYPNSQPSKDIREIAKYLLGVQEKKIEIKSIQDVVKRLIKVFS